MTNHRRESREGTHRIREFITSMTEGFYWKLDVVDEGVTRNGHFNRP